MQRLITRGKAASLAGHLHARPPLGYGFALIVFLIAFGLRWYFHPYLPQGLPFITFLPGVLVVAFFAGRGPAIAMALVSGVSAWLAFVTPFQTWTKASATLLALLFYLFIVFIAITIIETLRRTALILEQEREANAILAEQRAFLFRELQHRVANNMAFLVAILSMQKSIVRRHPRASEEVLDDAIRRIRLFSSIHRRLHDPDSATRSLDTHFEGLFSDLIEATGATHVRCSVKAHGITLSGETLTTLSLIAVELITNAIKHAFPDQTDAQISVYLGRSGDDFHFRISDNGVGKFDNPCTEAGLGCTIVEALCEQLNATQTSHVDKGTHVEIRFREPKPR